MEMEVPSSSPRSGMYGGVHVDHGVHDDHDVHNTYGGVHGEDAVVRVDVHRHAHRALLLEDGDADVEAA